MKSFVIALLIAGAASTANAAVVVFDYTAVIASACNGAAVNAGSITLKDGRVASVGELIHGYFSIDTATPLYDHNPESGYNNLTYKALTIDNRISFTIDQTGYSYTSVVQDYLTTLNVQNYSSGDSFDYEAVNAPIHRT